MDPTVFPVLAYSLTSAGQSMTELHDLAQFQMRPLLSSITGIASSDAICMVIDNPSGSPTVARSIARLIRSAS